MSEVRLYVIDSEHVIRGTIHGSIADAAVAALSAEPETIAELEASLARYIRPLDDVSLFATFRPIMDAGPSLVSSCTANTAGRSSLGCLVDGEPWDAGVVIIDLAARIVASESSYSLAQPQGEVVYHDGTKATGVAVLYRVPNDWLFVYSVAGYEAVRDERCLQRAAHPPLDARAVFYGSALNEFIIAQCLAAFEREPKNANRAVAEERSEQRTGARDTER